MEISRWGLLSFAKPAVRYLRELKYRIPNPVRFPPASRELAPVIKHLRGEVLSAGCGSFDLTPHLDSSKLTRLENCDVADQNLTNFFLCDLARVPRPDEHYDSILCNAVLEHTADPETVMRELCRLLKTGGHLILSVPFLQPRHPSPGDYTRYTRQGLCALAERTGFEVKEVRGCHSIAHLIGWVIWEALMERKLYFWMLLTWLPIRLWCLLVPVPADNPHQNVSAIQLVLRRP